MIEVQINEDILINIIKNKQEQCNLGEYFLITLIFIYHQTSVI